MAIHTSPRHGVHIRAAILALKWLLKGLRSVYPLEVRGHETEARKGPKLVQTWGPHVMAKCTLSVGPGRSLLLLADGARWIRAFCRTLVAPVPATMMIMDWWHLRQKCAALGSRICRGHLAKERFLLQVQRRLWRGDVDAACAYLEAYRPQARNTEKLEELLTYLRARQAFSAQLSAALHHPPVHRQRAHGEAQRSPCGSLAEGSGTPLVAGDKRCPGRAAHAAAQRRLGAVLAGVACLTLARLLTRILCALTQNVGTVVSPCSTVPATPMRTEI